MHTFVLMVLKKDTSYGAGDTGAKDHYYRIINKKYLGSVYKITEDNIKKKS